MEKRVFNHTAHKELWDWLSKNPESNKSEWVGWKHRGGKYTSDYSCFACDYGGLFTPQASVCDWCPLIWPQSDECFNSYYGLWSNSIGDERAKYARLIRDLSVQEGIECI